MSIRGRLTAHTIPIGDRHGASDGMCGIRTILGTGVLRGVIMTHSGMVTAGDGDTLGAGIPTDHTGITAMTTMPTITVPEATVIPTRRKMGGLQTPAPAATEATRTTAVREAITSTATDTVCQMARLQALPLQAATAPQRCIARATAITVLQTLA